MSKHTPGPWTFEPEPNGRTFSVWYDDDTLVAEVEREENARLIATSPKMLEGLKSVLEILRNGQEVDAIHDAHWIEMLIEEATGEVP